ncbi:isochorismatase family protein [Paraburkholderia susongensis]|uniref:Nicotinamidase-related amidase n=1 Tax=Paraburkholderia susongensis TaxID=1515439 RepID=A0A1X7LCY2_9BURK|nr:isochorismatase family protein [Paraburkholderia susongensis]SMG51560.1 Nicotinamidase-related amidase [Paraburkholderia susongensis]
MSITAIDPKTALIVVDLQKGVTILPNVVPPLSQTVASAVMLVEAFRRHDLPIVFVNVAGVAPGRNEQPYQAMSMPDDWMELLPELNRQPHDHLVTKRTWGAFTGTDLETHLRARGVTQVVLAGVSTSIGVESTARQAHELGFNVTLAIDAMSELSAEAHENSLSRIFPRLGETGTAQAICEALDRRDA